MPWHTSYFYESHDNIIAEHDVKFENIAKQEFQMLRTIFKKHLRNSTLCFSKRRIKFCRIWGEDGNAGETRPVSV